MMTGAFKTVAIDVEHIAYEHWRQVALLALRDADGWRHHGLGVAQKYVGDDARVHVWHPSLDRGIRQAGGAIHDHRFDLTSMVLAGGILNVEYDVSSHPDGEWSTWSVINASDERGPEPPKLLESNLAIWGKNMGSIRRGQIYRFPARAFHESIPHSDSVTVTVVHRYNRVNERARILSKGPPSHAFAEGHLPNVNIISEALALAKMALLGLS